eukprot:Phypoly_transcript_09310.p1 GENE.Phypoly_transcript_09310~~Phypoly_transcript_09310.p1  ORF type:complete len:434 (+),score=69.05 Phypoly_transcript_09310:88-1389(+)
MMTKIMNRCMLGMIRVNIGGTCHCPIILNTRATFSTIPTSRNNNNNNNNNTTNHTQQKEQKQQKEESIISPKIWTHLDSISNKYNNLQQQLQDCISNGEHHKTADLSKELRSLDEIFSLTASVKEKHQEVAGLQAMLQECKDKELIAAIKKESQSIANQLPALETELLKALLPKDASDQGNAILEIRAGTGGSEAQLFTKEIFDMYHEYANRQKWRFQVMSAQGTDCGGLREAIAEVSGRGVFGLLKFESGVHRVQRVPETETMGRVHTSTITVAVLPEAKESNIKINPKDLRIDVYRSSGAGGQSVNTTDSAVRITHIPTGTVVTMQDERSQIQNKQRAMQVLLSRLKDKENTALHEERSLARASQVGSGDRTEKIRTYNFAQNRVTDHRVGVTSHSLDKILSGEEIGDFIDEVVVHFEAKALEELTKGGVE